MDGRAADHAAIAEAIGLSAVGMCRGDAETTRAARHPECRCIGHVQGGLEGSTREAFVTEVTAAVRAPDPAPRREIRSVTVAGDIAQVHVEDDWLGDRHDDLLTLPKQDGRWLIVNKAFFQHPRP